MQYRLLLALCVFSIATSASTASARQIIGYDRRGHKLSCESRAVSEGMTIKYRNGMRRCHNMHYVVLFCENGRQLCSQKMNGKH